MLFNQFLKRAKGLCRRATESAGKYWEIIADTLSAAGWSLGWVSAMDSEGRTIWVVDAHRGDGKRFVVRANKNLTAFLELARMISTHLLIKDVEHP